MSFNSILDIFKSSSSGTDAFLVLKKLCEKEILHEQSSKELAALFMVYNFAGKYVLLYEDEPVTVEFSKEGKRILVEYMENLAAALKTKEDEIILKSLNEVSKLYMKSSRVF